jgi:hypothetical protein
MKIVYNKQMDIIIQHAKEKRKNQKKQRDLNKTNCDNLSIKNLADNLKEKLTAKIRDKTLVNFQRNFEFKDKYEMIRPSR